MDRMGRFRNIQIHTWRRGRGNKTTALKPTVNFNNSAELTRFSEFPNIRWKRDFANWRNFTQTIA